MTQLVIDWTNNQSHLVLNPLLPVKTKESLEKAVKPHMSLEGHLWLASSGTENFPKLIALSKQALLASAQAVNEHLKIERRHRWLNVLPLFHVGGLGIHARAFLTKSPLFDFSEFPWNPEVYLKLLKDHKSHYSSLTPTHVYDLVAKNLKAPCDLIGIIVGGGGLPEELHSKANKLGWPLFASYGMTEIGSQIATAIEPIPNSPFHILNHVQLQFNTEDFIEIKSPALFTGCIQGNDPESKFIDPKIEGWYTTQDKGKLTENGLQIYGRGGSFLKIGGENVNFSRLEVIWEKICMKHNFSKEAVLIDLPNDRLGRVVCLAIKSSERNEKLNELISEYHQEVLPLAKIRKIYEVESLPRSDLFKLQKERLRQTLML